MRVTRRPVRTAAVVTGAVAALLLPAAGAAFADSPVPAASDRAVFWRNVDLADGSLAKVYQDGPGRFSAEIYAGGSLIDTLVSGDGKPVYGENNGLHVVLRPDGTVSSWLDEAPAPAPKPKPEPAPEPKPAPKPSTKVVRLPGGHTATFFTGKDGRPCVKLSVPGGKSWIYDLHGTLVGR